jgi:hypothetical protein
MIKSIQRAPLFLRPPLLAYNAPYRKGVPMVAIQQETTVQPGGIIHIHSSELPEGARAQVIVLVDQQSRLAFPTMRSLLGAAKGSFKSAAEVDAFISAERDAWEK